MPEAIKMSEAEKIQEAVEKVRKMMCSLDKNPFQEYWWNDHRYSPIAQPFHREILGALSAENVHPYGLPRRLGTNDERQPRSPGDHAPGSRGRTLPLQRRGVAFHPSPGLGEPRPDGTTPQSERRQPLQNRLQMGRPGQRQPVRRGPVRDRPQMADLANANLSGADLSNADLSWASLMDADLPDADLTGADLNRTNLTGADLTRTNMAGANLEGANLRGATLDGTILIEADLTGANVTGVNLHSAYLDDYTKLDGAIGLEP